MKKMKKLFNFWLTTVVIAVGVMFAATVTYGEPLLLIQCWCDEKQVTFQTSYLPRRFKRVHSSLSYLAHCLIHCIAISSSCSSQASFTMLDTFCV